MIIDVYKLDEVVLKYNPEDCTWYAIDDHKKVKYNLNETSNFSPLLKILYLSPSIFFDRLRQTEKEYNYVNNELINSFPLLELILFCVKNDLVFWLELAIKWFGYITLNNELLTQLSRIMNDRNYPQKMRHQLKKILNQNNT